MQLGPEIKIDGKRPEWLKDDENIGIVWRYGGRWDNLDTEVRHVSGWKNSIEAIMLPADHPYYLATKKGFTYWLGGESAPDDWDCDMHGHGDVLTRCGDVILVGDGYKWDHYRGGLSSDIIGYRRKTNADAVYINLITYTEAYDDGLDIPTLEKLGLLADETLLEKFARENPYYSPDELSAIEEFINWQENNQ